MKFRFIYPPVNATRDNYVSAVDNVVDELKRYDSIVAIYQFGHFNSPGISDIDLMVIFRDGSECFTDPLLSITGIERSLFTHSVMGVAESFLPELMRFSFWHNYVLLFSRDTGYELPDTAADQSLIPALKKQIATEYLTSNYIDMFMQVSTRIIKVRSLLQHVKGFIYDFEFLGYSDLVLEELVEEVRTMISEYPSTPVNLTRLGEWLTEFFPEFTRFLTRVYESNPLYLPEKSEYRYGRNITIYPSHQISSEHSGFTLPNILPLSDKKYFRLNNRFNHYRFTFPFTFNEPFNGASERIESSVVMRDHNRAHFPKFAPLVSRFSLQL